MSRTLTATVKINVKRKFFLVWSKDFAHIFSATNEKAVANDMRERGILDCTIQEVTDSVLKLIQEAIDDPVSTRKS